MGASVLSNNILLMFIMERAVDVDNVILHWIKSQFEFMVNFESDVFIYLLILVIIEIFVWRA